MNDPIIDRSNDQKVLRVEKLRAELKEILRQSVPTNEAPAYWNLGWVYIMPDFDKPNHSIVEWLSDKIPVYPTAFNETQTEMNANERAASVGT